MESKKEKQYIQSLKSTLYQNVQTTEDIQTLRQCLEKCHKQDVLSWTDNEGYDILHHAILSGNIEALGIIFAFGLFKPPHEPKCHPYIHLASNIGNKAIVALLLQERPNDYTNKKTNFKWAKKPTEIPSLNSKDQVSRVSPLDVAGDSGHLGCVTTILDFYAVRDRVSESSENHLSLACAANSPSALRLLIKKKTHEKDLKAAVGCALKRANAECLDVLLRCNPNLTSLFSGMNLYHVLYSYSMSFENEWYKSLLAITSLLLKHKQNPVSAVPFRTYPLYSLLSHNPPHFEQSSPYIIACMVVLLNAGVDPNFNEAEYEIRNSSMFIQTAFGRSAYSSSFHCLFDTVSSHVKQFCNSLVSIRRFTTRCTETLLKHNADPNICGIISDDGQTGNALHAFLNISLKLGLDDRSITTFRLLIQNAADPNLCSNNYYPINTFVNQVLICLVNASKSKEQSEGVLMEYIKEIVESLLDRMTHYSVQEAAKVKLDGKPVNPLQKKILKYIKDQLNTRATMVWDLKALCKVAILEMCQRKPMNVVKLPLPILLKKYINGIEV